MAQESRPLVLPCRDLVEALELCEETLGFRLDMIVPADSPAVAEISRGDLRIRLEQEPLPRLRVGSSPSGPIVCRNDEESWVTGRAGMEYRDLIPGRLDGRFVASHIRISKGGEVADRVHYHKVAFQMIYCCSGSVRVVYEDQGPPFELRAGDCVLQPPEIRHRVLTATAGAEVIEFGSPALHETFIDHHLDLPTPIYSPGRTWSGQQFLRHVALEAAPTPPGPDGWDRHEISVKEASAGFADVRVHRSGGTAGILRFPGNTSSELVFFFVLNGSGSVTMDGREPFELNRHDSLAIPAAPAYAIEPLGHLELLEVIV